MGSGYPSDTMGPVVCQRSCQWSPNAPANVSNFGGNHVWQLSQTNWNPKISSEKTLMVKELKLAILKL